MSPAGWWLTLPVGLAALVALRPWRVRRLPRVVAWLAITGSAALFGVSRAPHQVVAHRPARPLQWVVLLDASPSMTPEDRRRQAAFVEQLRATLPAHVRLEARRFGARPRPGEATRLRPALLAAANADRIFLLSDGLYAEEGAQLVQLARDQLPPIDVPAHLPAPRAQLVAGRLTLLDRPSPTTPARLQLAYWCGMNGRGLLRVRAERAGGPPRELLTRRLILRPGEHVIQGKLPPLEAGLYRLVASLEAEGHPAGSHQRQAALVRVGKVPRVLLVSDDPSGGTVGRALKASRHQLDHVRPEGLPDDLEGLLPYREVVLVDIPASAVSRRAAEALSRWVRQRGGGLLLADARGALEEASWQSSPLAELVPLAPVHRPPNDKPKAKPDDEKKKKEPPPKSPRKQQGLVAKPVLSLFLVIDRSGSMQEEKKLSLAKEGAIACAEALHAEDLIGAVAFDQRPHVLVRPTRAKNRRQIVDRISRLTADGDTNIYRALQLAGRLMRGNQCPVKHLVLLSDGHTEPALFRPLIRQLVKEGITISVIGIGKDFDQRLLQSIARWGKGQFYFATDPGQIPQYVVRETRQALKRAARHRKRKEKKKEKEQPKPRATRPEERPRPRLTAVQAVFRAPFLVGLTGRFPAIGQTARARVRPGATVFLETAARAPLLAAWRSGLGRVGVFSGTLEGGQAGDWPRWRQLPLFLAQLVTFLLAEEQAARAVELRTDARWLSDGPLQLDLWVTGPDGQPRGAGVTVRHGLSGQPLPQPERIAPGRYSLRAQPTEEFPVLTIQVGRLERHLMLRRPLPVERRRPRADRALLRRLSQATGGRQEVLPRAPYTPRPRPVPERRPLDTRPLLAACLVLWCLGVGLWRSSRVE